MDDGTLHFSDHVNGPFDFTPHSTNTGGQQAYVIGRINATSTGMADSENGTGLLAFPTPFIDGVQLLPAPPANAWITVTDAMGRVVHTGSYTGALGQDWLPGVYALEIRTADQRHVVRVVKE